MKPDRPSSNELRQKRREELHKCLQAFETTSTKEIAAQILEIGFKCTRCGECCTGIENSVVIFPFEIKRILTATRENWLDTVVPPMTGEWDCIGNFHTLEWRIKKDNGSCRYYVSGRCKIYDRRPMLCSTYPFYLDDGCLRWSECEGLGKIIDLYDAEQIASRLIERSATEIRESIALLEKYEDFHRGRPSKKGACIVHDSEGMHRIEWKDLPGFFR